MKTFLSHPKSAALASFLLALPFSRDDRFTGSRRSLAGLDLG